MQGTQGRLRQLQAFPAGFARFDIYGDLDRRPFAWNRHDADALMSFMSEDCVFEASAGPDSCGTRHAGREAVKAGYVEVFTFRGGRIALTDSYRKNRPPLAGTKR